jgi:putative transposase
MASHVFHEIYLHLTWHTKNSSPLLLAEFEPTVHEFLMERCRKTNGVYIHGIGGTATHVHLAINIEPQVCISDLVGELKGSCSHELNKTHRFKRLEWQRGFGVVSFGKAHLDWVLRYVANQKAHHAAGRVEVRLERISLDDNGRPLD